MIRVGDIVRYVHPVENRGGRLCCGRVLAVDQQFVTVEGQCVGITMSIRVRLDKVTPDEEMTKVLRRSRR